MEPTDPAYTIFAEAMDRSGYARGTLATDARAAAPVPRRRPRPLLTMADMGMDHGSMSGMDHGATPNTNQKANRAGGADAGCRENLDLVASHNDDGHGAGNTMVAEMARSRISEPGAGLGKDGWRVLTYSQLRRATPGSANPPVARTLELHLTGNMERYM